MNSVLSKQMLVKKKNSYLLSILFMLAFCTTLNAATFDAYTDKSMKFKVFQQGGSIWMATNGGAIRWDMAAKKSTEFTTANGLSDNYLTRAIADDEGNVWFSSRSGLDRFDGQNWYSYKDLPGGASNFYSMSQVLLSNDAGKILYTYLHYDSTFFACFHGATQLPDNAVSGAFVWTDGEKRRWEWLRQSAFRPFMAEPIFDVASAKDTIPDTLPKGYYYMSEQSHVDLNGRLWIPVNLGISSSSEPLGYSMFDGHSWHHFFDTKTALKPFAINICEPAFPIDTGAGKFSYCFLRIDGKVDTINCSKWEEFNRVKDSVCVPPSMTIDTAGRLWIGTKTGILRCDVNGATEFNFQNGPLGTAEISLAEDAKKNIWMCGSNGLAIFNGQSWMYPHKMNAQIAPLFIVKTVASPSDPGGMWLLPRISYDKIGKPVGNGLVYYNGSSWDDSKVYTKENGLASDAVLDLAIDDQNVVWCVCAGDTAQLCRFKNNVWTAIVTPVGLKGSVRQLHIDKKGDIWLLADNSARYNGNEWQVFTPILYEGRTGCNTVFEDRKGVMWFATYSKGLCRYDGTEWATFNVDGASTSTLITSISEDLDGRLWVGLGCAQDAGGSDSNCKGVWRQNEAGSMVFSLVKETGFDVMTTIFCDVSGAMWLGSYEAGPRSPAGISRFDGSQWKMFTKKDGLSDNRINTMLAAKNGDIWFATSNGVSRLRSGGISVQHVPRALVKRSGRGLVSKLLVTSEHHTGISTSATLYDIMGRQADLRLARSGNRKAQGIYISVLPKNTR